jgi:hypothetical protein
MSESSEKQQEKASNDANLSYWLEKWQNNKIGFHRSGVNE